MILVHLAILERILEYSNYISTLRFKIFRSTFNGLGNSVLIKHCKVYVGTPSRS